MADLKYRQEKIQEKRKKTTRRDFVMEIASWFPVGFYKIGSIISRYPNKERVKNILPQKDYEVIGDQLIDNEYNNNQNFWSNYVALRDKTFFGATTNQGTNENADYAIGCFGTKDIYLSCVVGDVAEKVLYSLICYSNIASVYNSVKVMNNSHNVYDSFFVTNSYQVFYSKYIFNSSDIWFSSSLIGCTECIFCDNLENTSYCISNKKYEKDEYYNLKKNILKNKQDFINYKSIKLSTVASNYSSSDVSGSAIFFSRDVQDGYVVDYLESGRNVSFICGSGESKNLERLYDVFECGIMSEDFYGVCCGGGLLGAGASHYYCSVRNSSCFNIYYCYDCFSCSFCLGCIGLKNKSYCILNKQYTKEERYEKVDEIFAQMEKEGTLGEFFPATMNPFYFNDTAAYLIDQTFTKEEVTAKGYLRRDEPVKVDIPEFMEVVKASELDQFERWENNNRVIEPSILKKIIVDEQGNNYRVIKMEYDFLLKYGLPLPKKHRLDRMKENFRL